MSRVQIRRRADGLVELSRLRTRDVVLGPAYTVLFALLASWVLVVGGLTAAVLEFPQLPLGIATILPCVLLALWAVRVAHIVAAGPAPVDDPPPRPAA